MQAKPSLSSLLRRYGNGYRISIADEVLRASPALAQPGFPLVSPTGRQNENFMVACDQIVEGPDGFRLFIPKGFAFDFASVPWFARWLVSRVEPGICLAALVHDFLYDRRSGKRRDADLIFYAIVRQGIMSPFKAWLVYAAVRLGGRRAWRT